MALCIQIRIVVEFRSWGNLDLNPIMMHRNATTSNSYLKIQQWKSNDLIRLPLTLPLVLTCHLQV